MKLNDIFPSEFLKSSDIGGIAAGKRVRAIISDVNAWEDNQGKRKLSIGFVNARKRLLANVTNARTIARAYGDETNGWIGKPIILFVQMVDFRGTPTEALRILIPQPEQPAAVGFQSASFQPPQQQRTQPMAQMQQEPPPVDSLDAFDLPVQRNDEMNDEIPF